MIRIIGDHDVADAAALIAGAGYALIPVMPCSTCGLKLPTDHKHRDTAAEMPVRPGSDLEARLTNQGVAAVLEAVAPGAHLPVRHVVDELREVADAIHPDSGAALTAIRHRTSPQPALGGGLGATGPVTTNPLEGAPGHMINSTDSAGRNGSAHLRSENTISTLYDVVARLEDDANRHEQQCMDLRRRAADVRDMACGHHDETTVMCRHCQIPTIKDQLGAWTHVHGRTRCHETGDSMAEPITQETPPSGTPVPATAMTEALKP